MSRDSEKVLKELQKFLDAHAEDTENEADVDALAERFFAEYNLKCKEQKESAPETADDYLDLAEQVTSKKRSYSYLHSETARRRGRAIFAYSSSSFRICRTCSGV